jgi:protein gp37
LGDIFSADVTFNYLKAELIDVATSVKGSRHIWMILTKRPSRMVEFAEWLRVEHGINWPANIWAGTSVTGVRSLKRIDALRLMDAVKFVSAEPLVDDIGVPSALFGVDLIIIGGESNQGPHRGRPFDLPWPRRIIGVAKETGTAVFMKQLGSNPVDSGRRVQLAPSKAPPADWENPRDGHGDDWTTWPEDLRVRQMPAAANVASTHKENLF